MSRSTAIVVAVVCLAAIGCVSAVLVVDFNGRDTPILLAAILGFLTPTSASLLTLLQAAMNAEKTQQVSTQVADVNQKVNGHLARLTQIVVDSAAANTPISTTDAAALATHTERLTGQPLVIPAATVTITPPETSKP